MTSPIRVISLGSVWEIDPELMRYRRYPKVEKPRDNPAWADQRAGALQDFVWHPMTALPYVRGPFPSQATGYNNRLFIQTRRTTMRMTAVTFSVNVTFFGEDPPRRADVERMAEAFHERLLAAASEEQFEQYGSFSVDDVDASAPRRVRTSRHAPPPRPSQDMWDEAK